MRAVLALVLLLAVTVPGEAGAEAAGVVAVVTADFFPAEPVISQGSGLFLVNADFPGEQNGHDVVHPEGLFGSDFTRTGEIAEVVGVSELAPGRYPFRCSVHQTTMTGTLVVIAP